MNLLEGNAELARTVKSDPRWASIVAREAAVDGKFYYSVKTTAFIADLRVPHGWRDPKTLSFTQRDRGQKKRDSAHVSGANPTGLPL